MDHKVSQINGEFEKFEEQNLIGSLVTEILRDRRTDGQTSFYFVLQKTKKMDWQRTRKFGQKLDMGD